MATTVRQILDAAYGTSKLNQPGQTASETGELLQLVLRNLRGFFAEGARINRKFFGRRITVTYDAAAGGWPRPDEIESIAALKAGAGVTNTAAEAIAVGADIVEVPFDQTRAEPGKPATYAYGQVYFPAGNAKDPVAGDLVFLGSTTPAELTALDGEEGTLDPLWPEQFNQLLILDVARYLAVKDGNRENELAAFGEEYKREHARFTQFLEHETTIEVKSYGHQNRINSPSINVG